MLNRCHDIQSAMQQFFTFMHTIWNKIDTEKMDAGSLVALLIELLPAQKKSLQNLEAQTQAAIDFYYLRQGLYNKTMTMAYKTAKTPPFIDMPFKQKAAAWLTDLQVAIKSKQTVDYQPPPKKISFVAEELKSKYLIIQLANACEFYLQNLIINYRKKLLQADKLAFIYYAEDSKVIAEINNYLKTNTLPADPELAEIIGYYNYLQDMQYTLIRPWSMYAQNAWEQTTPSEACRRLKNFATKRQHGLEILKINLDKRFNLQGELAIFKTDSLFKYAASFFYNNQPVTAITPVQEGPVVKLGQGF